MSTTTGQELVDALQAVYEAEHAKVVQLEIRTANTASPYDQMCLEQQRYVAHLAGKVAARARDMLIQLNER